MFTTSEHGLKCIGATLWRVFAGFTLAGAIGSILELLLGGFPSLGRLTSFLIDFFRPTLATAMFPLFILIFGIHDESKIALVTFSGTLIMVVSTTYGVRNCNRVRLMAAQVMGATKLQRLFGVVLPEALPYITAGLRLVLSLSLVVVVITEMFLGGTKQGLGKEILDFHMVSRTEDMYAVIFITGLIGLGLNKALLLGEARIIHWWGKS